MKKLVAVLAALGGFFIAQNAWATCSNYTSYVAGQTLTAASLNSLQTNYTDCSNNILNGDTFTGSVILNGGSDFTIQSDVGTTNKAFIDGATGAAVLGLTQEGQMTNCGVTVSGSTLTIAGYDGTALSATNPCVVAIRSSTAGNLSLAYFTANISTTFGAASDTDDNTFGITAAADWASTMPMFLGVVNGSTAPFWTISRLPYVQTGAAATALCQEGDTDCDAQLDMLAMTTGLTLANEVDKPVTQVGWVDATWSTTNDNWTLAVTGKNGFNTSYETIEFTLPTGQMGAESGKVFTSTDGGTSLAFGGTFSGARYYVSKTGMITLNHTHDNQSANGADGTAVRWMAPFSASLTGSMNVVGSGEATIGGAAGVAVASISTGLSYATCRYAVNAGVAGGMLDNDFSNTNDLLRFTITYPAF